ncbi:MAG: fused MFS/spermidine synthase [Microthrixaceae bacterium]
MRSWRAPVLVFGASAAVLVLEIIAGRLLAPYVGVSLETFTGIIGTCLAGIAAGAWLGGNLADQRDPRHLIGPFLLAGGALTWLSLPVVAFLGPQLGDGPVAVVLLTTFGFGAPIVLLSAVAPMAAKVRLDSLSETGSVVGGLSAAGTLGALAGTFLTGFVAVSLLPSRPIVVVTGALVVAAGVLATLRLGRTRTPTGALVALPVLLAGALVTSGPCEYETSYYCVRIETPADEPSQRDLYLDRLRHASVDLEDPDALDIRYIRLFADVVDALPEGPIDVLHIGGGGFTLPRWIEHVRPGSTNHVLELDGDLVGIVEGRMGLVLDDSLTVRVGDARLALPELEASSYDLVVGDAFAGESAPWHLTTLEVMEEIERVLRPGGVYVMNLIDGGSSRLVKAELATLARTFEEVGLILPADGIPGDRAVNQVLVASDAQLPHLAVDPEDGRALGPTRTQRYAGDAMVLTDDHAPVDQLVLR